VPAPATAARPQRVAATWSDSDQGAPPEIDLRGMERDEALAALDAGLDRAVLGGLSELRIVHGIGRGVLRDVVERHLRAHPQVASQRLGRVGEGGRGVTVVAIK
jgi:DNA mismatch repair protein MutS2